MPIRVLKKKRIYKKLAWLNELPSDEAEYVFGQCCGSSAWARQMAKGRPYPMLHQLFDAASRSWTALDAAERNAVRGDGTPDEKLELILQQLSRILER